MASQTQAQSRRRRKQASSSEEAYAGPLLTPPPSSVGSPSKRMRRTYGSSEESDLVSTQGLIIERHRVFGPNGMKETYAGTVSRSRQIDADKVSDLDTHAVRILSDNGFLQSHIQALELGTVNSDRGRVLVYRVHTTKLYVDEGWVRAADALLEVARELSVHINIHIANMHLCFLRRESRQLSVAHPCCSIWNELEPKVIDALKPETEWQTVQLVSRGRESELPEDLFCPTILIVVHKRSKGNWPAARERILASIDQEPIYNGTAVEVFADEVYHATASENPWLDTRFLDGRLRIGASIGVTGDELHQSSSGTLGCVLRLQFAERKHRILALTNWHVLLPRPKDLPSENSPDQFVKAVESLPEEEQKLFTDGYLSKEDYAKQPEDVALRITAPCVSDIVNGKKHFVAEKLRLERKLEALQQDPLHSSILEMIKTEGVEKAREIFGTINTGVVLSIKKSLLTATEQLRRLNNEDFYAGRVFAGSGFRCTRYTLWDQTADFMVDWGLVDLMPDRIPRGNDFERLDYGELKDIRDPQEDERVMKCGRITGYTGGFLNNIRVTRLKGYRIADTGVVKYQTTYTLAMYNRADGESRSLLGDCDVAKPGDSGAVVYTEHGAMVGLLWGGELESGTAYVIPAMLLCQDIKDRTGAIDVTLPQELDISRYLSIEFGQSG